MGTVTAQPPTRTHLPLALRSTFAFVAAEAVYGLRANSLALLADAGHNFTDVLGLLLAWGAAVLSKRLPTVRRTAHHAMAHDHAHVHDEHHRHDHED